MSTNTSILQQIVYNVVKEVERLVKEKYAVKVVGNFTIEYPLIKIAFASDTNSTRLLYLANEALNPENIQRLVADGLKLKPHIICP